MKHNQKYEDFVMNTVRQQRTPRTLQEAYMDGEYGYSIHLFKEDARLAIDFTKETIIGFVGVMLVSALILVTLIKLGVL